MTSASGNPWSPSNIAGPSIPTTSTVTTIRASRRRRARALALTGALLWLPGLAGFALKRLRHHPGLTVLALLGVVLTVGLVSSAGFFSEGVDQTIVSQELAEFSRVTRRPAFSVRIYNFPSPYQPLSLEEAEKMGRYVASVLATEVGLPPRQVGLRVEGGRMELQPREGTGRYTEGRPLGTVRLVYVADIGAQMGLVAGDPLDEGPSGKLLDVWMHNRLAEEMGVQIGDEFAILVTRHEDPLPVRVKGTWEARDPTDSFWFSDPDAKLREALLVRRHDYIARVEPMLAAKTRYVAWDVVLDQEKVIPAQVPNYLSGFDRALLIINRYLPNARLIHPEGPLKSFVQRQTALMMLLLGFNVPAFGLLLSFLALISAIISRWQRRETAILVSRGMSTSGVLGSTLIEELILFVVGCPLGVGFGMLLGRLMGYSASFLSFASRPPLPVSLQGLNASLLLAALGVTLIARLWPVAQAARQSVVEQEREHARPLRRPFWRRYYLDFLLIVPTAYAYRQLSYRGALAVLVDDWSQDLYSDPLLILVPALFILTAALLAMRVFPLLMSATDRLANLAPWAVPHLALRQLGRHSHGYISALLLVIVSLALGVYTLSMATSLDQWLVDRQYYRVGADLAFEPFPSVDGGTEGPQSSEWIPPVEEFFDLPGVRAATRVGEYRTEIAMGGGWIPGRFLAVDRLEFPSVGWFRPDFADVSLGALMNRLALHRDGILLSQQFLNQHQLQVGDLLALRVVMAYDVTARFDSTVVGAYHYFPTVYEDDVAVIGNLEYLFSFFGATFPHHIWLSVQEDTEGSAVFAAIPAKGIDSIRQQDTRAMIAEEQEKVERVGVFGSLSVGFLAAAAMGTLGLLLNSYASLRARVYQFAVLRAIGLSRLQIAGQVILEYGVLIGYGAGAGALIGSFTSQLLVPFFRISGEAGMPLPPLLPIIPQQGIRLLVGTFAGAMILTQLAVIATALSRGLSEPLRLGH